MMVSHWLVGRRGPSAAHFGAMTVVLQTESAEREKALWSEFLWQSYYEGVEVFPGVLRAVAEKLLTAEGLPARLLALLSWYFEKRPPLSYAADEVALSPLWRNRMGWLYESAGLSCGYGPEVLPRTGALSEISARANPGMALRRYLARQQTAQGQKWQLYDLDIRKLKKELDWQREYRPPTAKSLEVRVADAYDVVLGKLARLEQKDIDDILAMVRAGHVEPGTLLNRLNDNLAEVKCFLQYRQNAKLLFSEFLERPIVFKGGKARFI